MWKIVERSETLVLYIYIYIDENWEKPIEENSKVGDVVDAAKVLKALRENSSDEIGISGLTKIGLDRLSSCFFLQFFFLFYPSPRENLRASFKKFSHNQQQ